MQGTCIQTEVLQHYARLQLVQLGEDEGHWQKGTDLGLELVSAS